MNSQTVIQALINDQLIVAAKMYTFVGDHDKVAMLCACATGVALDSGQVYKIMAEIQNEMY